MEIFNVFVDMQATGDRIKQLRKEKNMRVFDLANALGLESEQAIYKWQRGQCLPNADNLVRLSILFGCHIEDILIHYTAGEDESPLLSFYRKFLYSFSTTRLMKKARDKDRIGLGKNFGGENEFKDTGFY